MLLRCIILTRIIKFIYNVITLNFFKRSRHEDVVKSDNELLWNHAFTIAFRGGHDLRKQLNLDEDNFRLRAPYSHNDSKKVFIYQAIDEAQKAATCLIRWKEFFSGDKSEISNEQGEEARQQVIRITEQAVLEEQSLRSRKLTEILVDLILFLNTNEEIYFKDYFYFCELNECQYCQADRNEFFGFKSKNTECHIEWLRKQVLDLENNGLDINNRWYIDEPKSICSLKQIRLSSFRAKYKKISLNQNPEIMTLLGKSYLHVYGESRKIHFSANDTSECFNQDNPSVNANKVAVLIINLLLKAQELSGLSSPELDKLVLGIKPSEVDSDFYKELRTSKANLGDYVLAGGDLGKVIEERKSKYGYYAYNIRYISRPPLEETPDDWFASFQIKKLGSKNELLNNVKAIYSKYTDDIDVSSIQAISDEEFEKYLCKSVAETIAAIKKTS